MIVVLIISDMVLFSCTKETVSIATTTGATSTTTPSVDGISATLASVRQYTVDNQVTSATAALFYNMYASAKTSVMVGQQEAYLHGYGMADGYRTTSDMYLGCGKDPAINGSDFMFITSKMNTAGSWWQQQETQIVEAVKSSYAKGIINTFCWHYYEPYDGNSFYANGINADTLLLDFPSILPGGVNHKSFTQSLRKIASIANELTDANGQPIPFIFRPFHECNGNWFWWGAPYCTPAQYKQGYQFVVTYLRDSLNVHTILYEYSPNDYDSSPYASITSSTTYFDRYPGDAYVDIVGFDGYNDVAQGASGASALAAKLQFISNYAGTHHKIAALAETGFQFPSSSAPSSFFTSALYAGYSTSGAHIGYMMFWYNTQTAYYVPTSVCPEVTDFKNFVGNSSVLLNGQTGNMFTFPTK